MGAARYDGIAEWYDAMLGNAELGHFNRDVAARLLGPGPGRLIDVGCGGGVAAAGFAAAGWTVAGVDLQLERFEEPDARDFPKVVALRLRRPRR